MENGLVVSTAIPSRTRELMLCVWGHDNNTLPLLFRIRSLERCDDVLAWLVDRGLTGRRFVEWLHEEFNDSLLKAICFILRDTNRKVFNRQYLPGERK